MIRCFKLRLLAALTLVVLTGCKQNNDQATLVNTNKTTTQPIDLHPNTPTQRAYYKDIDFTLRGEALKQQLCTLLRKTHQPQKYTPNTWEVLKSTDVNPSNHNELLLIYSHGQNHSTRKATAPTIANSKANRQGVNDNTRENFYEREHVFPKSLAKPKLNTYTHEPGATAIGLLAGTDMHNIRASNGAYNNERGNRKFADDPFSTLSHPIGQEFWFPGDQWKGDVARMMMYMYLRYGQQCAPQLVGTGPLVNTLDGVKEKDMLALFLKWNAEDPVSDIERKRNEYHSNNKNKFAQGNRNPFIDNPFLANLIWETPPTPNYQAQNTW